MQALEAVSQRCFEKGGGTVLQPDFEMADQPFAALQQHTACQASLPSLRLMGKRYVVLVNIHQGCCC
jgi:hypothetical protein